MSYTARLAITVPAALYDTACAVARALDPDVGGANSFGPRHRLDEEGNPTQPSHYSTETPCTTAFATQAKTLMAAPQMLHAVVLADYATRWPDIAPPSLADMQAFAAMAVVTTSTPETPQQINPES